MQPEIAADGREHCPYGANEPNSRVHNQSPDIRRVCLPVLSKGVSLLVASFVPVLCDYDTVELVVPFPRA